MWEIFEYSEKENCLLSVEKFEDFGTADRSKSSKEHYLLYSGNITDENFFEISSKVNESNGSKVRLVVSNQELPSNCWCLIDTIDPRRGPIGAIECSYCNSNGYCWIVNTGHYCRGDRLIRHPAN